MLTRVFTGKTGARALALAAFLFLLNAFVQSGGIQAAEVVVGAGWLALCYVLSGRCSVPSVLVPAYFGCVVWGLFIESQPVSDWMYFFQYASQLSQGLFRAAIWTKSFPTVAYGAVFHLLLGSGLVTNYISSALVWMAGAAIVYAAILPFTGQRLARFVCFALALCPTFLVFSPVLDSKAMFFLVSAVCGWLVSKHLRSTRWNPGLYAGLGIACVLLFLTRPHGVLLLGVCAAAVAVTAPAARPLSLRFSKDGAAAAAIVAAAAASVVLTVAGISSVSGYGLRGVFHPTGWVYVLYGTNADSGGQWNDEDVALITDGRPPFAELNRRARELALERLAAADPLEFAGFALTTKMENLYGRDPRLLLRAYGMSDREDMLKAYVQPAADRIVAGAYRLVFLLFLALLAREVWRPSRLWVLGVIVLLYSLPHLLVEVDQRMAQLMLPYFITGAVLLVYETAQTAGARAARATMRTARLRR